MTVPAVLPRTSREVRLAAVPEGLGGRLRSGETQFPVTRIAGIERAPQALQDLTGGRLFGTVVVELTERA
ncbi:hypothetical protein ACFVXA_38650 [Streptomyces sp. NPDC058246]|uniref:hypothetical protein n=1 Tax=Streptomyces sp. NPDC058246 TaxID=3346400 RepID=UPI0036F0924D